jgi:hypothetical protein
VDALEPSVLVSISEKEEEALHFDAAALGTGSGAGSVTFKRRRIRITWAAQSGAFGAFSSIFYKYVWYIPEHLWHSRDFYPLWHAAFSEP